ncbi:MAG: protein phosphatase 2C domain-containing protein [Acetobacteraceae bacterium]|nr:protein phosphatase 2C domain-containing protein [Acetobacteraceae bacterium]
MIAAAHDWAVTHPGAVRPNNQDALVSRADAGLWAVADGAGGHRAGEVASAMIAAALDGIPSALGSEESLVQIRLRLAAVHDALRARAAEEGGMIASTVVVLLVRDSHFVCLWAGDSRAYILRDGSLTPITRDHSLVQTLIDAGSLSEEDSERHPHANVITRAVGGDEPLLELDKVTGRLVPGDRFLLCSDGLSKTLDLATMALLTADPADPANRLVESALLAGVRDNVTAVVVQP